MYGTVVMLKNRFLSAIWSQTLSFRWRLRSAHTSHSWESCFPRCRLHSCTRYAYRYRVE